MPSITPSLTALPAACRYALASGWAYHAADTVWLKLDGVYWPMRNGTINSPDPDLLLDPMPPDDFDGYGNPIYVARAGMSGIDGVLFEGQLVWPNPGAAQELLSYLERGMFPLGGQASLYGLDSNRPDTVGDGGRTYQYSFYDCVIDLATMRKRIRGWGGYPLVIPIKAASRRSS